MTSNKTWPDWHRCTKCHALASDYMLEPLDGGWFCRWHDCYTKWREKKDDVHTNIDTEVEPG